MKCQSEFDTYGAPPMLKSLTIILAFLMTFGSQANAADDLLLRCTLSKGPVRHYLLLPGQKIVKRVGVKEHPTCTLSTTDISYYWECKETKTGAPLSPVCPDFVRVS